MRVIVGAPRFNGSATAAFVKSIIDGIMVALHWQPDAVAAAIAAERLGLLVKRSTTDVMQMLTADDRAPLGPIDQLRLRSRSRHPVPAC